MRERRSLLACGCLAALLMTTGCGGGDSGPTGDGGAGLDAAGTDDGGGDPGDAAPDAIVGDDAQIVGDADVDAGGDGGGPVSMPCAAMGMCDPFDRASCPGMACRPGMDGTRCAMVSAMPLAEGAPCRAATECGPGLLCLDFGAGFTCHRMCPEGSIGFCADGEACLGTIGDPCIQVCRPFPEPCNIYTQDCADATDTCTLATHPETGARYTGCRPAGTQGHLDPCGAGMGACGHGLICVREAGASSCRYVCGEAGGPPTCTVAAETCDGLATSWRVPYCR